MSIPALASSAGRMAGPPLFGYLYLTNERQPFMVAAVACAGACAAFLFVLSLHTAATRTRPAESLGELDAARLRMGRPKLDRVQEATITAVQAELREILLDRGYSLRSTKSRMYLVSILDHAFPHKVDDEEEEALLAREVHQLHQYHQHEHAHHS